MFPLLTKRHGKIEKQCLSTSSQKTGLFENSLEMFLFINKLIQCNDLTQGLQDIPWFEEKT